jgi:hypothetical protein
MNPSVTCRSQFQCRNQKVPLDENGDGMALDANASMDLCIVPRMNVLVVVAMRPKADFHLKIKMEPSES